jgi:hypothetical protein
MDRLSISFKNFITPSFWKSRVKTTSADAAPQRAVGNGDNHDGLFLDAIHAEHDGATPYGSSRWSLSNLRQVIRSRLDPRERRTDGNFATGFAAITRTPQDLFNLSTSNGQVLRRSQAEIETHVLLESQFRHATFNLPGRAPAPDSGDAIDLATALQPAASALQPAVPVAAHMASGSGRMPQPHDRLPVPATPATLPRHPSQRTGHSIPALQVQRPATEERPLIDLSSPTRTSRLDDDAMFAPGPSAQSTNAGASTSQPTIDRQSPWGIADPGPQAGPPATQFCAMFEEDRMQNHLYIFKSDTIDMSVVDKRFLGESHQLKGISGATGNCWLRSGWTAAILQHRYDEPGKGLVEHLKAKLGPDYFEDVETIGRIVEAARNDGIRSVMTSSEGASLADNLDKESTLKLPGRDVDTSGLEGDAICNRLTYALLKNAGLSDAELKKYVIEGTHGEIPHIATLMRELDSDLLIYGRTIAWDQAKAKGSFQHETSSLTLCARPGSPLASLTIADGQSPTDAFLNQTDCIAVFVNQGRHHNLCIPAHDLI